MKLWPSRPSLQYPGVGAAAGAGAGALMGDGLIALIVFSSTNWSLAPWGHTADCHYCQLARLTCGMISTISEAWLLACYLIHQACLSLLLLLT